MRFGVYLIERGLITADQLVAAMQVQQASRPQLGQLAIEQGRLTVREVLSIVRVQSDLPHDRFGETAIELGLLTRRDVAELLLLQSDRQLPLDQVLVNTGAIEYAACQEELERFRRGMEGATKSGEHTIRHIKCPAAEHAAADAAPQPS